MLSTLVGIKCRDSCNLQLVCAPLAMPPRLPESAHPISTPPSIIRIIKDSGGKQKPPRRPVCGACVCCEVASCDAAEAVGSHLRLILQPPTPQLRYLMLPIGPCLHSTPRSLVGADTTNSSVQAPKLVYPFPAHHTPYPSSCCGAAHASSSCRASPSGWSLAHQGKGLQLPILPKQLTTWFLSPQLPGILLSRPSTTL
jgi:hypothetical protein